MARQKEPDELLRDLFNSEGARLYGYLVKKAGADLAQDIVQESFTRLYVRLSRSADIANARAYLYQIARHQLFHESAFAKRYAGGDALLENLAADAAPGDAGDRELMQALQDSVGTLAAKERELFEMRWYLGLTQAEIAVALKKSERQIRRDIEKLVTKLRAELRGRGWLNAVEALQG
ncbi:RNA polymerase sigma factor [Turneriella parva]|uniref:RNA polymerase, sigma-24 subunit, ECF subfamily n=1 Tax=Turneriella parva (strain ATCC BAA-1111 / DSM 21527 / NCTC 11395 / H) TaxID=869212 RepID=I4B6U2_TURPD|nr:sigma-70 family RNA polymerase sigma factor [Turneriella parva]AFM12999.1 RNA polymerase, sigma-24 subunit, ECF subfamily [Turneriella parva DSM 21527]